MAEDRDDEMEPNEEDEAAAQCPICLLSLSESDVGTPECCDHDFCLRCILEWSKQKNTCPNDRQVFHIIFARHSVGGNIYEKIEVADAELKPEEELEDEPTFCEVCGECNDEDRLLLCDECDNGYHLYCLTPALDAVPQDNWYCPECTVARGPQPQTASISTRGRGTTIPRTRDNIRIYRRVALALSSGDESSESEAETEVIELDDSDEDIFLLQSRTTDTTPPARSTRRTSTKRKAKRSPRKKRKTRSGSKYSRKSMRHRFTRTRRKTSTRQRLAGKLGMVPSSSGGSLPLIKQKKCIEEKEGLSVYGDKEVSGLTLSSPVSKKIVINIKQQSRKPTSVSENSKSSSTDLLSSIMDEQSLLGSSAKDIEITQEGRLKLKPSAPSGSLNRHASVEDATNLQRVTPNSSGSTPSKNTSLGSAHFMRKSSSQPNNLSQNHVLQEATESLPSDSSTLQASFLTSNKAACVSETSRCPSIEDIPLPDSSQKRSTITHDLPASCASVSLDSIPLPGGEPVLQSYTHLRPQPQIVTACPVYIKKEGRAAYDSHDRDSIRKWFYQEHGERNGDSNMDDELSSDGDDIVALTPPTRSPEPVIYVTTDSEDERNNIKKPPRRKKNLSNDTPVYSISSSSESEHERRQHTSKQNSRIRRRSSSKKRSRRNSLSRRHRRSRSRSVRRHSRHRSKSLRRYRPRSHHRSRSRHRNGSYSRRRSPTPDRHHHSSIRERSSGRRKESRLDRNRQQKRRTRSPMNRVSKSVSKRLSPSPSRPNRLRSPYHRRGPRKESLTPERMPMHRRSISPVQSSISPARLRRDYERSRRCESKERAIAAAPLSGTSQTLFSEIERGYKRLYEEVEVLPDESTAEIADEMVLRPDSKSKGKKKLRSDSKKKKKQKKSKASQNNKEEKKRKKHTKRTKEVQVESDEEGQLPNERTKSRSEGTQSSCGEASRVDSSNSSISSDKMSHKASPGKLSLNDSPVNHSPQQASALQPSPSKASLTMVRKSEMGVNISLYSPSEHAELVGDTNCMDNRGYDTEDSMKQMVIDIDEGSEHMSPTKNHYHSPVQISPTQSSVTNRSATPLSPAQHATSPILASPAASHDGLSTSDARSNASMKSTYTPEHRVQDTDEEDENGQEDAERLAEEQALRIIELLKNEVAEPDVGPPAQPPKSVSQKPEVLSWIAGNDATDRITPTAHLEGTPPIATNSQTAVEYDLPASATELSNKQLMAKMVGKERIADEIKIVLKPFYCSGKIDKDEYKQIMRNCVTKIYQKSQGKVNPMKVREFVEKYVGTVIARRKR
ncbi:PHD and RING finger domain-containing protein 1-like [Watersipora subatra]|uniref:PHD and RING finger domain-containing protein 1-like n=1 Tax=Watersipora subatra TaxID=2589382 RepID=UPI00355B6EE4